MEIIIDNLEGVFDDEGNVSQLNIPEFKVDTIIKAEQVVYSDYSVAKMNARRIMRQTGADFMWVHEYERSQNEYYLVNATELESPKANDASGLDFNSLFS